MSDAIADRLEACYSGAVYDVLRTLGHADQVLPTTIRPLDVTKKLTGRVYTVNGHTDENLDAHETLLQWTGLLSKAPCGSVVICQPNDSSLAHMGELSAETMMFRGVRGYIVDGGCRDSDFIGKIGFSVWCRYFTPRDVVGRWVADSFGEPITIGGVLIHSGDYVLADSDGVVIIPSAIAEAVTSQTKVVMQTENLVRKAILEGIDPQQAYLEYGKF